MDTLGFEPKEVLQIPTNYLKYNYSFGKLGIGSSRANISRQCACALEPHGSKVMHGQQHD
eukprot:161674-Amphidinium_carterae.1